MPELLVQGCSKSKNETKEPLPAFELYDGYYYKIIKKSIREEAFRSDLDLCILSAEYGLVDPDTCLSTYERRMTATRADELRDEVREELRAKVREGPYEHVLLNLGSVYERAVRGFDAGLDIQTTYLSGSLGERGRELKQFVRTDETAEVVA